MTATDAEDINKTASIEIEEEGEGSGRERQTYCAVGDFK
jgi:hypothetical protein